MTAIPEQTEREQILAETPKLMLLGGQWVESHELIEVINPATAETIASVHAASASDVTPSIEMAQRGLSAISAAAPRDRADWLYRTYELLQERSTDLATIMTFEMGKPYGESLGEVRYAGDYFRWFAEQATRVSGEYRPNPTRAGKILTTHKPVGPALLVTPWNFPLAMGARKIAPAIAAGCPFILKPASATPLTSLALGRILLEAGVPSEAVTVLPAVSSTDLVSDLMDTGAIKKLSFTGSTAVGKHLLGMAAPHIMRTSLELGGNAPFIVFEDADLDIAVEQAMIAKLRNSAQACTSANRFLIHEQCAPAFTKEFSKRMATQVIGHGFDAATTVGPVIHEAARDDLVARVAQAVSEGAIVETGGTALDGPGFYFEPTVLTNVQPHTQIVTEETFGPIAPIQTFDNDQEAINLANDTDYGLSAYVFTNDINRALKVGDLIESGMIGINQGMVSNAAAPFGGVGHSGLGREGGFEGIHEYLDLTYIAIGSHDR